MQEYQIRDDWWRAWPEGEPAKESGGWTRRATVAIITQEPHRPYQRPPLSKGYMVGKEGLDEVYLKEEGFYGESNIEVLSSATVRRSTRPRTLSRWTMAARSSTPSSY